MQRINVGRWVLGSIVAAAVFFVGDSVVHGILLSSHWKAIATALGTASSSGAGAGDFAYFIIYDLLKGFVAVWIYAAIRPRFGAGPATAVLAGVATWLLVVPTPMVGLLPMRFFGRRFIALWSMYALVPTIVAALAGAWLYREEAAA